MTCVLRLLKKRALNPLGHRGGFTEINLYKTFNKTIYSVSFLNRYTFFKKNTVTFHCELPVYDILYISKKQSLTSLYRFIDQLYESQYTGRYLAYNKLNGT